MSMKIAKKKYINNDEISHTRRFHSVWFDSVKVKDIKNTKVEKSRQFFFLSLFYFCIKTIATIVARAFFPFFPRAYSTFGTICGGERPRLVPERRATGMRLLDHVTELAYFASRHVSVIITVIVTGKGVIVIVGIYERKGIEG